MHEQQNFTFSYALDKKVIPCFLGYIFVKMLFDVTRHAIEASCHQVCVSPDKHVHRTSQLSAPMKHLSGISVLEARGPFTNMD